MEKLLNFLKKNLLRLSILTAERQYKDYGEDVAVHIQKYVLRGLHEVADLTLWKFRSCMC